MQHRQRQRAAFRELLTILFGSRESVQALGLLTDGRPNSGLFGPGSVTWSVLREPVLLLSGSRALLMQVAHPLVAQSVLDYSAFESKPFDRLLGTIRWVATFVFGTSEEARGAVRELRLVHERVRGRLELANATATLPAGAEYSALAPDLATWVYATLVDSTLVAYEALVGGLSTADADRLVREWVAAGELLEVHPSPAWRTAGDLEAYVRSQVDGGAVAPVMASRRAAKTILTPPLPWPLLAPISRTIAFLTAGLLPPRLRAGYGIRWSADNQRMHLALCAVSRRLHPLLPRQLRVAPLYDLASGRLDVRRRSG